MKSVRNKIYFHNGIIIITIVLILEIIFGVGVRSYYIGSIEQELLNKADILGSVYSEYLKNETVYEKARYILENESNDYRVYFQVFDSKKNMLTDSNGFSSDKVYDSIDINLALRGKSEIKAMKINNERVMSVAVPLYYSRGIEGVLRYIISIEDIEKMMFKIGWISLFIGACAIVITFLFSSFLAKGIVNPIKELTNIAETMAEGDFSKRAFKKNNDEIGKLGDTLNYMADEIVKSDAAKNEFISSISHELRTPLTAIKGWSEIMLTGEIENFEEAKEGMNIISSEAERLKGLVEELLDFSKLQSGRITLNLEKIDMNDLVIEVCSYFKKRAIDDGIRLNKKLDDSHCTIMGDVNRLKQVLINIIDNAIKFSKADGEIDINTYKQDNSVFIEIVDNGIGILPEDIHRVTEKFYKGKSKKSGSGIGLAICKEIVSMHGGTLKIDSRENEGTKVVIKIFTNL